MNGSSTGPFLHADKSRGIRKPTRTDGPDALGHFFLGQSLATTLFRLSKRRNFLHVFARSKPLTSNLKAHEMKLFC